MYIMQKYVGPTHRAYICQLFHYVHSFQALSCLSSTPRWQAHCTVLLLEPYSSIPFGCYVCPLSPLQIFACVVFCVAARKGGAGSKARAMFDVCKQGCIIGLAICQGAAADDVGEYFECFNYAHMCYRHCTAAYPDGVYRNRSDK